METAVVLPLEAPFVSDPTSLGLRATAAFLDRGFAAYIADIDAFDRAMGWAIEGSYSLRNWLVENCRHTRAEASQLTKMVRYLRVLPATQTAFLLGVISRGQLTAILANVTERTVEQYVQIEAELAAAFADLGVDDTSRVMREWAARAVASLDVGQPEPDESDHLHLSQLFDNTWKLDGSFTGNDGKTVQAALDAYKPALTEDEPERSRSQLQAEALVEICAVALAALAASGVQPTRRQAADFTLTFSLTDYLGGGIAKYADGTIVAPSRVRQLLCNAVITPLMHGDAGQPLWLGRTARTATSAQWRALAIRDRHCAFPGCQQHVKRCEAHHVQHWEHGGSTDIDQLVLLCWHHHRTIHTPGWTAHITGRQQLEITRPDGHTLRAPPHGLVA